MRYGLISIGNFLGFVSVNKSNFSYWYALYLLMAEG